MSAEEDLSQERRITFCLYEYWEKLAGETSLPALKNMNRDQIAPFKKNLVLIDLRAGQENPVFQVIGQDLQEDLEEDLSNKPVSSVPRRTMLSRVTDHYMEVLANRVPIAFEAEFVNKDSEKALYRGILLPFSDDNKNINFILGGVRWILEKDVTLDDTKPTIEELMRQIAQGRDDHEPETDQPDIAAESVEEETKGLTQNDLQEQDHDEVSAEEEIIGESAAEGTAETEDKAEEDVLSLEIEADKDDLEMAFDENQDEATTEEEIIGESTAEDTAETEDKAEEEVLSLEIEADKDDLEMAFDENQDEATTEEEIIGESTTEDTAETEEKAEEDVLSLEIEADKDDLEMAFDENQDDAIVNPSDAPLSEEAADWATESIQEEQTLGNDDEALVPENEDSETILETLDKELDGEGQTVTEDVSEKDIHALDIENEDDDFELSFDGEMAIDESFENGFVQNTNHDHADEEIKSTANTGPSTDESQVSPSLNVEPELTVEPEKTAEEYSLSFDIETTPDDTDYLSGEADVTYQPRSVGGLLRKEFLPIADQEDSNAVDIDEDDEEFMLTEADNAEEYNEPLENEESDEAVTSFSELVNAIQEKEHEPAALAEDLNESDFNENILIEGSVNTDEILPQDQPDLADQKEEEIVLEDLNDEDMQNYGENALPADYFADEETEDVLELTETADDEETADEEVVSDDSAETSPITDNDLNIEENEFHEIETTEPFENQLIDELTSEQTYSGKPTTIEGLLAQDDASENIDIEETDAGSADLGISEVMPHSEEKTKTILDSDDSFESLAPIPNEEELSPKEDKAAAAEKEEEILADDDDLSIEELMQSIIAERKFDQAYVREQEILEEQKREDQNLEEQNLSEETQDQLRPESRNSASENTQSNLTEEKTAEEMPESEQDAEDAIVSKNIADPEIINEAEGFSSEEKPEKDEIDNHEEEAESWSDVVPDNMHSGDEERQYNEDPLDINEAIPVEPAIIQPETTYTPSAQNLEAEPENSTPATASLEVDEAKPEKPRRRGSVIERAMEMMSPKTVKNKSDDEIAEQVLGKIEAIEKKDPVLNERYHLEEAQQQPEAEYRAEPDIGSDLEKTNEITQDEHTDHEIDSASAELSIEASELDGQIEEFGTVSFETLTEEADNHQTEKAGPAQVEDDELNPDVKEKGEPEEASKDIVDEDESAEKIIEPSTPESEVSEGQTLPQLRKTLKQVIGYIKKEDANHNRSRDSLYNILTAIYEFYDICEKSSDAFDVIVNEHDLKVQSRAPYTPVLKICLGTNYDKTRLTEYAAAIGIGHYMNIGVSEFHAFIKNFPGGIKGCVKEMRNIRKHGSSGNITARKTKTVEEARAILREMAPIASFRLKKIIVGNNVDEFCLLLAKRDGHDINVLKILDDKYTKLEPILKRAAFIKGNLNDRK